MIIRAEGKICLFVTHRIEDALDIADRVLVLAPSARLCHELTLSQAERDDPAIMAEIHNQIVQAIGGKASADDGQGPCS